MSVEVQAPPESTLRPTLPENVTMTEMVKGILMDVQTLLGQQVAMVRAEIRADWVRTRSALIVLIMGVVLLLVSAPLVFTMVVYLLHDLTSKGVTDPAGLPLWACYGLVGGLVALVAGCLIWDGVRRFRSFTPVPEQSLRALEENVRWLTKKT
jgi:hypothetical protein